MADIRSGNLMVLLSVRARHDREEANSGWTVIHLCISLFSRFTSKS